MLGCNWGKNQQDHPSTSSTPNPSAPPISVTALTLTSAYEASEVAADEKYRGKDLLVTGTFMSYEDGAVQIKGKDKSTLNVKCSYGDFQSLDDPQKSAIVNLGRSAQATVQGTCNGKILNVVELKGCVVK